MLTKKTAQDEKTCLVTFELPAEVHAETACLCGEFNEWDKNSHQMKRDEDGGFAVTLSLETGRRYPFRYWLDGERWQNDWAADGYERNSFGTEDSVVEL